MGTSVGTSRPRWVAFDASNDGLDEFLHEWKPSHVKGPHVEWICISHLPKKTEGEDNAELLLHAWEFLCLAKGNDMTCMNLQCLARFYHVLAGKWLIYVPASEVDVAWCTIASAVQAGKLGGYAKVSTKNYSSPGNLEELILCDGKPKKSPKVLTAKPPSPEHTHVICVYSSNFDDLDEVFAIRDCLSDLGFCRKLRYKPDAYSFYGVYSENQWGISPTIYSA